MSNKQQKRIEWPGDWVFYSTWAYHHGLSNDSRGSDAIDRWASTATPEEIDFQLKRAYSYGWLIGYAGGYAAMDRLWKWFFGSNDRYPLTDK